MHDVANSVFLCLAAIEAFNISTHNNIHIPPILPPQLAIVSPTNA